MSLLPTEIALERARLAIETATKVGRARSDEMFRAVNILQRRAEGADKDVAMALLEAAQEILADKTQDANDYLDD